MRVSNKTHKAIYERAGLDITEDQALDEYSITQEHKLFDKIFDPNMDNSINLQDIVFEFTFRESDSSIFRAVKSINGTYNITEWGGGQYNWVFTNKFPKSEVTKEELQEILVHSMNVYVRKYGTFKVE